MRGLVTAAASAALLMLSAAARAEPPFEAGREVIDPWPSSQTGATNGPSGAEIIDPWRGRAATSSDQAWVVNPWKHEQARVPTRILPAPDIVDPWAHSR